MDYTLAKSLKDAGFKFKLYDRDVGMPNGINDLFLITDNCVYYIPTLSELIEACPRTQPEDEYGHLGYLAVEATDEGWEAGYNRFHDYEGNWLDESFRGATPEEAVARLYLALAESRKANEDAPQTLRTGF